MHKIQQGSSCELKTLRKTHLHYKYTLILFSPHGLFHTQYESCLKNLNGTVFTEKPPCTLKDDLRFIT